MAKTRKKYQSLLRNIRFNILLFLLLFLVEAISYQVLRIALLKNSQELGTALAQNCASEGRNTLTVYETLLTFGTDTLREQMQSGNAAQDMESWLQTYFQSVQTALGKDTIDPYGVINGKIVAANPWEGDATYDYSQADWHRRAMDANGQVIFTDVYVDAISNQPIITLAQQVVQGNDVLAFDIFPKNFSFSAEALQIPEGGSLFLCDSKGALIYKQTQSNRNDEEIQKYLKELVESIHMGDHAEYDSSILDMDGNRRGVYYSFMPNGWIAIVTIPFSSILGNLSYLTIGFLIVFLILLLGFGLSTWKDMRTQQKMERTNETVRVLGNSYYALYRVDFGRGTYEMIKGSDYIRSRLDPTGNYVLLLNMIGEVLEDDAREEYMESFSLENIRHLVKNRIRDFGGDFLRRFGEEYRWVNIRVLFDESLQPEEVVLCFREVDREKRRHLQELRLLENSLQASRQSEESKQSFFSRMSHDMRTPLNAIIGLSELATVTVDDPVKTTDYLKKIDHSSRQLLELINEILDMSRLEQGKIILSNKQFNLQECVEECADTFRYQAQRENKKFTATIDIGTPFMLGDPFRITQILNNLLSNAFKFTSEDDSISLSVKQTEGQDYYTHTFVIEDTGIGMSKEFLSKIYEPYAREIRFGTKQVEGTGLGMAIVKSLVEQMNGRITVKSEQGKGSTFTIILPLFPVKEDIKIKASTEAIGAQSDTISLQDRHILLAEDNVINMEIATEVLTMNGIRVTQAWNGKEALDIFTASSPFEFDAILMDMQMPEMDGCEATMEIRRLSRPDAKTVPIIAVTANAFAEDIAATAQAGMNAHISKPIDFQSLCTELGKLLN